MLRTCTLPVWFLSLVSWLGHIPSHVCCTVWVRLLASVGSCVQSAISFAKTKPRLKSVTLIPVPKSTSTFVGWIMIAFSWYVTRVSTVVAYNHIVVFISLVGVVIPVVLGLAVRPIVVILVLLM